LKNFRKGAWPGLRNSKNFGGLTSNKDTNFKFGMHADMNPEKKFSKWGMARVT